MSGDFLKRLAATSALRVNAAKRREPEAALLRRASDTPPAPRLLIRPGGFELIAEYKRRAPSIGTCGTGLDTGRSVRSQVDAYTQGGAAAISVLTEPEEFGGSLADLSEAVRATHLPVMRKDFLVDPYQVLEARSMGAAGVLLILRILDDASLRALLDAATETGLFVLLEAFDSADVSRAATVAKWLEAWGPTMLVGVNARDLNTLEPEHLRFERMTVPLPRHVPRVAESSLVSAHEIRNVTRLGYDAALVGTALMRAHDPARLVADMIAAGRAERKASCVSA